MTTKSIGDMGERAVSRYLALRLYEIVARNYRSDHGEIDIIALRGNTLCFVEVKTRDPKHTESFGSAASAVTPTKQKHIIYTAKRIINENPALCRDKDFRFDVAEVYVEKTRKRISYLKDAFKVR